MLKIGKYNITSEIHLGKRSSVYRGLSDSDTPIIIKLLNREYPDQVEINRFKNEFEILKTIQSEFVVKPIEFIKHFNSVALVFPDVGSESLTKTLGYAKPNPLKLFFNLSKQIVAALTDVHKASVVHNDIKSQNIIYNKETDQIKLIDFGSATLLLHRNFFLPVNSTLYGTLGHISPEQTGRMNRTVDYRTDFYSLGVTLYQMLTGELPFIYTDPLEMIHSHLAKTPISPFDRIGAPKIVSDIIMKLLEKNPEARYQTSSALLRDLENCESMLLQFGLDTLQKFQFPLGENDVSAKFQISKKLYGRNQEIILFEQKLKNVCSGNLELLLISGKSGIGKSALINEIQNPISSYRGIFTSGKFDLHKRSIPYRAITISLQKLVRKVLSETEGSVEVWKNRIGEALGSNAQVAIDLIPELETLLGKQNSPPELDIQETENRFHGTILNLLRTFCSKEHPFVLFLDDLQWADQSSVRLIRSILFDSGLSYLFIVLSYRDNELNSADLFSKLLEEIVEKQIYFTEINLKPLPILEISNLIADTLHLPLTEVSPISEIVYSKTKGNPFHVGEVLKKFYDKEYVWFSGSKWEFNLNKISSIDISENVIDILIERIKIQPPHLIEGLKLMACIGNWFRQDIYATIAEKPFFKATMDLVALANEELLVLGMDDVNFIHDKVREAIYLLIEQNERSKLHYKIGKTYLSILYKYKLDDHIFTIINQLNLGLDQVKTEKEKKEICDLNEQAGFKALASSAYESAFIFFAKTVSLLPENYFKQNYTKAIQIYLGYARFAYLSKNFEVANQTFEFIISIATNDFDKIQVYELQSSMLVTQNRITEVLETLKRALSILGVNLPKNAKPTSVLPEIIKFKIKHGKKAVSSFEKLPISNDQKFLSIMRLLNACVAPSFLAEPNLFPVVVLKMVNHTLKYGLCEISAFGFTAFGMIQGSGLGNFPVGYEFGKLGIELFNKFHWNSFKCRTLFLFACMVNHWKEHAKEGNKVFWESYHSGIETGDLQYAAYSLNNIHFQLLLRRESLSEVFTSMTKYDSSLMSLKQNHAYQVHRLNMQFIQSLRGETDSLVSLNGKYFDEVEITSEWESSKNANALFDYHLCLLRLNYFYGNINTAYEISFKIDPLEGAMFGMMFIPEYVFFSALVCFEILNRESSPKIRKEANKRLQKFKSKLQVWAREAPSNYLHKFKILSALDFYLQKKFQEAISELKIAIAEAKHYAYQLEEALANEFAANIWDALGEEQYRNLHLVEAHYRYGKYGMIPKIRLLESANISLKKYAGRNFRSESTDGFAIMNTTSDSLGNAGSVLDLSSVMKASQTIAGEIQLKSLLEKMMKILLENAGAERGFFILKSDSRWSLIAERDTNLDRTSIYSDEPIGLQFNDIGSSSYRSIFSLQIIGYVARTKDVVILGDAKEENRFIDDPYFKEKDPKSILCYPILHHGEEVGIVYLENNLTSYAFTPGRVEILKMLSSQIAVSIENSMLYESLESKVTERTLELNSALTEVKGLKEQQDGDYFLASLLIEPLTQNNLNSAYVKLDYLTEQKKKFKYKQWSSEIGGDISVSSSIVLNGKKFIVILNGDAMGKSMQGASGALVIGSVFEAIIKRTNELEENNSVFPEKWLYNTYLNLHNTMSTFDGSMLISMFLCLVDEETGFLYFLNSEHPRPAIYREETTFFLPHKYVCAKLGLTISKKALQINTFQLEKNDVLLIGSDGRDDILLHNQKNEEIINEDETLFLVTSREGKGNLESILSSIKKRGDLIDDLSLVRVEYIGEGSGIHLPENSSDHPAYVKALKLYLRNDWKNVLNTLGFGEESFFSKNLALQKLFLYAKHKLGEFPLQMALVYSENNPSDTLTLFYIAEALFSEGQTVRSFEYSERVRLRRPYHKLNNELFTRLESSRRN